MRKHYTVIKKTIFTIKAETEKDALYLCECCGSGDYLDESWTVEIIK